MRYNTPKLANEKKTSEKTKLDIEAIQKIADVVRRVEERLRGSKLPSRDGVNRSLIATRTQTLLSQVAVRILTERGRNQKEVVSSKPEAKRAGKSHEPDD
jgi:hypothetical protein